MYPQVNFAAIAVTVKVTFWGKRLAHGTKHTSASTKDNLLKRVTLTFTSFIFALGLTWIFGILYFLYREHTDLLPLVLSMSHNYIFLESPNLGQLDI
jgi:hypothetical protein